MIRTLATVLFSLVIMGVTAACSTVSNAASGLIENLDGTMAKIAARDSTIIETAALITKLTGVDKPSVTVVTRAVDTYVDLRRGYITLEEAEAEIDLLLREHQPAALPAGTPAPEPDEDGAS